MDARLLPARSARRLMLAEEGTVHALESQVLIGDESKIRSIIDSFPSYVIMVDSAHRIVMANQALYDAHGLRPDQVVGAYCPKLIHDSDGPFAGCPLEEAHRRRQSVERELYDDVKDSWMMSATHPTGLVTVEGRPVYLHVVSDITGQKKADQELARLQAGLEETVAVRTRELESVNEELRKEIEERRRAEETIRQLAYYDGLTGLPNRTNFSVLLASAIKVARRYGRKFALAMLDLDGLKVVNDTLGHDAGDKLLHLVGKRFDETLRGSDSAARMGGDEFLFIFAEIEDSQGLELVAERLLESIREPFSVQGKEIRVTASVGGAIYPDDGEDEATLMKQADVAMYQAKNAGGNRFCRTDTCSPRIPETL